MALRPIPPQAHPMIQRLTCALREGICMEAVTTTGVPILVTRRSQQPRGSVLRYTVRQNAHLAAGERVAWYSSPQAAAIQFLSSTGEDGAAAALQRAIAGLDCFYAPDAGA